MCRHANGDAYEGAYVDANMEGMGIMTYKNGDTFVGSWIAGQRARGLARFFGGIQKKTDRYSNGDIYDGEFVNDKPEGKGKIVYSGGNEYEGDVKNGIPSGIGFCRWATGDSYKGSWLDDKPNGRGIYKSINGDVFVYDG